MGQFRTQSAGVTAHRRANVGLSAKIASILLLFGLLTGADGATADAPEDLILGVHPYLSYAELQARFQPLTRYLARHLKRKVSLRIGGDYDEHVDQVGLDRVDIAYIGPVSYVRMVERFGPKPLLARLEKRGSAVLSGHIVVHENSPIRDLSDLKGKSFGFGDPNSTMSNVVPRAVLANAGIDLAALSRQMRYRGHTNIAFAVLSNQVDAGAVKSEVYQRFAKQGLRSIARLPEVSEHLFVTRADLPAALVARIRDLMLNLGNSVEGRIVLKSLHSQASGLVAVSDDDYATLRSLLATMEGS